MMDAESAANCKHTNLQWYVEGDEMNRWTVHYCRDCGFDYNPAMGSGSLRSALAYWPFYVKNETGMFQLESLALAEQEHARKFVARQAVVMAEIEEIMNTSDDDLLSAAFSYEYACHSCGYCGSEHCYGGCQLGGLG